jgi:hypothetical protein
VTDFYPQKTADELLALLNALQNRATRGQVYFTTVAGLQSEVSFQQAARPEVEIRRVLYSLHRRDPDTYPDPYAARIRRTRSRYTFS